MQAVIARYTGVLAAADVPTFTTSTSIPLSVRLDLGTGSQVTRDGKEKRDGTRFQRACSDRGPRGRRARPCDGAEAGRRRVTVIGVDRNEDGPKELPDGIRYEAGDATTRPWPGASSTGSLLRSDRPACWSTPEARITWAGREHGPAGLGAGGPDPGADFAFELARNDAATAFVQR